jgi:mannose-6-phosphate isomerase
MLYPLRFVPIIKEKIWGGNRLNTVLNKNLQGINKAGESWEISAVGSDLSIVENGFLQGNNIQELIEIYMGDLVGDKVYDKFGIEFPLLIKFIDANDYLSVQIHPDDETAMQRHNSFGKTEMWYIIDAEEDAELILGFSKDIDKKEFLNSLESKTLRNILHYEKVKSGEVYFIPSGRLHGIGAGILLAEIQQTSDITYRVYDWDRVDDNGKARELHIDNAIDVIDYKYHKKYKTQYKVEKNKSSKVIKCDYFTTNLLSIDKEIDRDYNMLDSFVIYMAVDGDTLVEFAENKEPTMLKKGETILIPAELKQIFIKPVNTVSKLLEIYIE